jgi:hypothetical protein
MTTSATAKTPAAKSTPAAKTSPVTDEKSDNAVVESPAVVATEKTETPKNRIPDALNANPILAEFCRQYLNILDEIADYNKAVLAEKSSDWTSSKVLEKSRELSRPTDKNVKPKAEIKTALEAYEDLVNKVAQARKKLLDVTSAELGITLSATSERNPELEAPLKEKRKHATEIGNQLGMIAKMTNDTESSDAVNNFLENNGLPAIGRDQVRTFGADGVKSTPKYRVNVTVADSDGNVKAEEAGFTKIALAITNLYERGKAPKADTFREVWEKAGNSPEKTVTNPVVFEDNNLTYTITKK